MQAGFRYTPVHKTGRLLAIVYRGEINRGVSNYQVSHALLARASLYIVGVWIRQPKELHMKGLLLVMGVVGYGGVHMRANATPNMRIGSVCLGHFIGEREPCTRASG